MEKCPQRRSVMAKQNQNIRRLEIKPTYNNDHEQWWWINIKLEKLSIVFVLTTGIMEGLLFGFYLLLEYLI